MYTLVLMMALNNGSAAGANPEYAEANVAAKAPLYDSRAYFGRRGGCNGCYGGCNGGCRGGWGGCRGGWGGCNGCSGGWSCHGCHGGYIHAGSGCCGGGVYHGTPAPPRPETVPAPKPAASAPAAAPVTLVINVPAQAVLTIDGTPTQSVSAQRTFVSPPLEPGYVYHYQLKIDMIRDGQMVSASKRIEVRPGERTEVTLEAPPASVAQR